jgi:hypothetical protein
MNADKVTEILKKPQAPPQSLTTHVTMIAIVALTVIGASLTTFLYYAKDDSAGATRILGFTGAIVSALLALRKAEITHLTVNSRMTQWTEALEAVARGEGRAEGVEAGRRGENGPKDAEKAEDEKPPAKKPPKEK